MTFLECWTLVEHLFGRYKEQQSGIIIQPTNRTSSWLPSSFPNCLVILPIWSLVHLYPPPLHCHFIINVDSDSLLIQSLTKVALSIANWLARRRMKVIRGPGIICLVDLECREAGGGNRDGGTLVTRALLTKEAHGDLLYEICLIVSVLRINWQLETTDKEARPPDSFRAKGVARELCAPWLCVLCV